MKHLLGLLGLFLLAASCQTDRIAINDKAEQAESFVTNTPTAATGQNYFITESLHPDYQPRYIQDAISATFTYRNQSWTSGAAAMHELAQSILTKAGEELDVSSLVDFQLVSYMNFDRFIQQGTNDPQQAQYAAQNLQQLMAHAQPTEWRVLAQALRLAEKELPNETYTTYAKYTLNGARDYLKGKMSLGEHPQVQERLQEDARLAIALLE